MNDDSQWHSHEVSPPCAGIYPARFKPGFSFKSITTDACPQSQYWNGGKWFDNSSCGPSIFCAHSGFDWWGIFDGSENLSAGAR